MGCSVIIVVVLLTCAGVHGEGKDGFLLRKLAAGPDRGVNIVLDGGDGMISEGYTENVLSGWKNRDLERSSCDETYGFLPCTKSALGNLFLMALYGYPVFLAAKFRFYGREPLSVVTQRGIKGSGILTVLGAFPNAFLLFESGISTDESTRTASRIMLASTVPLLIVQIPRLIHSSSAKRILVLVACIAAILYLLSYCIYKVRQPWIRERHTVPYNVCKEGFRKLLQEDRQLDRDVCKRIFDSLDSDGDKHLSKGELRGLLVGLQLRQQTATAEDALDKIMAEFDTSRDGKLDLKDFEEGMCSLLHVPHSSFDLSNNYSRKISHLEVITRDEFDNLLPEDTTVDNPNKFYLKAVLLMLGGFILGVFAYPFVEAINNFSYATNIPPFFVAFLAMPLATNSSESVSAIIFASRKKKQMASLTYSEIYGAVTMNNTLCFGVFLAIVYIRGLEWDFSAEALIILLIVLVMGLFGSFWTTFPLWMSFVAFLMYPLILAVVYVLDYVLGWS